MTLTVRDDKSFESDETRRAQHSKKSVMVFISWYRTKMWGRTNRRFGEWEIIKFQDKWKDTFKESTATELWENWETEFVIHRFCFINDFDSLQRFAEPNNESNDSHEGRWYLRELITKLIENNYSLETVYRSDKKNPKLVESRKYLQQLILQLTKGNDLEYIIHSIKNCPKGMHGWQFKLIKKEELLDNRVYIACDDKKCYVLYSERPQDENRCTEVKSAD